MFEVGIGTHTLRFLFLILRHELSGICSVIEVAMSVYSFSCTAGITGWT